MACHFKLGEEGNWRNLTLIKLKHYIVCEHLLLGHIREIFVIWWLSTGVFTTSKVNLTKESFAFAMLIILVLIHPKQPDCRTVHYT